MSDDLIVRLTLVADALNDAGNYDGEEAVLEAVQAIREIRLIREG